MCSPNRSTSAITTATSRDARSPGNRAPDGTGSDLTITRNLLAAAGGQTRTGDTGAAGTSSNPAVGVWPYPVPVEQRMQAIVQTRYGTDAALRLERTARPRIAEGEVLVPVRAAGLDRARGT